jgi:signal transduction histidine kinase
MTDETRLRILSEAGMLFAASLDYATTLASVARLAVGTLADWCIVDVVGDDGRVSRLEVAHGDPRKAGVAAALRTYPLDRSRRHLVSGALQAARSELHTEVTPEFLEHVAQSPTHLALLRELEARSLMVVPLAARERTLGALVLAGTAARPAYGEEDLRFAEELARRSALALDNARLYRDAQRAIRARDEVLSVISHDLGNALAAIFMGAGLLGRALAGSELPQDTWEPLEAIRRSAEQMQRLRSDMLQIQRLDAGALGLKEEAVRVAPLVRRAREMAEPLALVKSQALELEDALPPGLTVIGDRDRLLQVFSNLVGNAVKFTPIGGRIDVRAAVTGEEVEITVQDSGPGIPEPQRQHLFQRFRDDGRVERQGMGLGLYLAREIVELHGGRIRAESPPGGGSSFVVTLPLETGAG